MKIRSLRLLVLALILCSGCRGVRPEVQEPLCILYTNDVHGHILPERVMGWDEELGGAAVLGGCVNSIRKENRGKGVPTLLLDGGDFYLGTPEGDSSKGAAVIEVMNALGYDALVPGNHDWDAGVGNVMALASQAKFPFLAANVINPATGAPASFLRPYLVKNFGRLRVGVIGVTLEDMTPQEIPGGAGSIVCAAPEEHVRSCIEKLRTRRVNFVILLSHLGLRADQRMARDIEGIGVIIGGHHHLVLKEPYRSPRSGTVICQAGSFGKYAGKLELTIDPRTGKVGRCDNELIPLAAGRCPADPAVGAIVEKWRSTTGRRFDEVLGSSESDFRKDRAGVAVLGEMVADGMREATGAQIAFSQRHGIRGALLKGTIRYRDVYSVWPFDDTLWTVTLTGAQIRGILEKTLSFRRPDNLRFSGLTVEYDPRAPRGGRIATVKCGGGALDDGASYRVAVNTYLVHWGFIKELVAQGRDLRDTNLRVRDVLGGYIRAHSPLSARAFRAARLVALENAAAAAAKTPRAEVVPAEEEIDR